MIGERKKINRMAANNGRQWYIGICGRSKLRLLYFSTVSYTFKCFKKQEVDCDC